MKPTTKTGTTGTIEILSVCMICKRAIGARHQPTGAALAPARNHSHGVCAECAPGYCRQLGLGAQDTERVLARLYD